MRDWIGKTEFLPPDIEALIGMPETPLLEFKEDFSVKGGGPSPWHIGKDIPPPARDKFLNELVAFANADGGWLILGVEETTDKPRLAKAIKPLPRIHELADRIGSFSDNVIDPPLPKLNIHPVEIADGAGVIVVRVPRSELMPHRVGNSSGIISVRRHTSAVPIGMREASDLAIRRHRSIIEGIWAAAFGASAETANGGIVTFYDGMAFGGDSQFYYKGQYDLVGDEVRVDATVRHYFGSDQNSWGDRSRLFGIIFRGLIQGDEIKGQMWRPDINMAQDIVMQRAEKLP